MNIIQPSHQIMGIFPTDENCLKWLEAIGRTCYKSEDKITAESAPKFVKGLLKLDRFNKLQRTITEMVEGYTRDVATAALIMETPQLTPEMLACKVMGAVHSMLEDPPHESVIEHSIITVRFIFDRGISHEAVRHRLAAITQESTRYVSYGKEGAINVIEPIAFPEDQDDEGRRTIWKRAMEFAQAMYMDLLDAGATPQNARSVLPTGVKTEVVMSANFREWRHIFRLRTSTKAHPQMREVMVPLLQELQAMPNLGLIFSDIRLP